MPRALTVTIRESNLPGCPKCGHALRLCAARDPACAHCDHCQWAGDPTVRQDARPRALPAAGAAEVVSFLEVALEDAEIHGQESEPDMEVGDLQGLARLMWKHLTPAGRAAVASEHDLWSTSWAETSASATEPPAPPANPKRARRLPGKRTPR